MAQPGQPPQDAALGNAGVLLLPDGSYVEVHLITPMSAERLAKMLETISDVFTAALRTH